MSDINDRAFLGSGWSFPPRLDTTGELALVDGEDDIREAIRIILETAPGERPMRPEFGVGLRKLVFAPLSRGTISVVQFRVEQALVKWEPRIDVQTVKASVDMNEPGRLLIEINYRVRDTNTFFNFVYPFYLTEGRQP